MPNPRILLVDDDPLNIEIFQDTLEDDGYDLSVAENGEDCLALARDNKFDVILLDIMMPGIDGYTVCETLKQDKSLSVKIILVSGKALIDEKVKGYDAGADEYITKPFDIVELRKKVQVFVKMAQTEQELRDVMQNLEARVEEQTKELQEANNELLAAKQAMEERNVLLVEEQNIAKKIFDNMTHIEILSRENIRYYLSPMSVFAGDMLVAAENPYGSFNAMLGDFTNHGLSAAIGVLPTFDTFRAMIEKGFAFELTVKSLNSKLCNIMPVGNFCAACCVIFDVTTRLMQVWNGGLPDALMVGADGKIKHTFVSKHMPLGVLKDDMFDPSVEVFPYEVGDRLYIYSDGILEAKNADGELFGKQRLLSSFDGNQPVDKIFDHIIDSVKAFTGTDEQSDDVTLCEIIVTHELMMPLARHK